MAGMFYNLGRALGPKARKGKWIWTSLTGDDQEILEAEHAVGRDMSVAMREQLGVVDDVALRKRVDAIGEELAARVANKQRQFSFIVCQPDEPNALALPGGFVFVTAGLIELIDHEDDALAFVLGHEMAHVIKQHAVERLMSDAVFSAAMRRAPGGGAVGRWAKSTGMDLLQSAYSQDNELVADLLGQRLTVAAGYDPRGSIRMFEALKRLSKQRDDGLWEYFASHPPLDRRIATIENDLKKRAKKHGK